MISLVPSGKVASTWTSAIISLTPSMTSSRRQDGAASAHDLGHALAVAGQLQQMAGNQGHRLGVVQLQAASPCAPGQLGGDEDQQLVAFLRGQVHDRGFPSGAIGGNLREAGGYPKKR